MGRDTGVEAQLFQLMAADGAIVRDAPASAAQQMADAMAMRQAGHDDPAGPLFCAALLETLAWLVEDRDVELRRAIAWHRSAEVRRYTQLLDGAAYAAALRAAKKLGDVAYPARIEREPDPDRQRRLVTLAGAVKHARGGAGSWADVLASAAALDEGLATSFAPHGAVLEEKAALDRDADVSAWLALRASTRAVNGGAARGRDVEDHVGASLTRLCAAMNAAAGDDCEAGYRIARGAHVPAGLRPENSRHVKGEIDFLLMHGTDAVLIGETKAGGATAIAADCVKFRNGVVEMAARAQPGITYPFAMGGNKRLPQVLHISGASLRRLADTHAAWPVAARYFLPEPVAAIPLSPRAIAYITQQPASIAVAERLMAGETVPADALLAVWQDLAGNPRLAWIWEERVLAGEALHAIHGSQSVARFTDVFARMAAAR